jgi:predicted ATPase
VRLKNVHVSSFKSLVGFDLRLDKFTCLIGLNGSGKSTVLQFLDFMGRLVQGDLEEWFKQREWKPRDVMSRHLSRRNVEFKANFTTDRGRDLATWVVSYNPYLLYCTQERIEMADVKINVAGGECLISTKTTDGWKDTKEKISFKYEGSILSQLRTEALPQPVVPFKIFLESTHSLDMLTPDYLRQRTRQAGGSLGLGGQRLASFIRELPFKERGELVQKLKTPYPTLSSIRPKAVRGGWNQLNIIEWFDGTPMVTEARHVNDGMLRLLAILAELTTNHSLLMFDEIENGINPELIEFLIDELLAARQQLLVTTHSPLVLNYLEDEIALKSVQYLYKTATGFTKSVPFYEIPSIAEKLQVMGPGEVFVDTNLTKLADEITRLMPSGD